MRAEAQIGVVGAGPAGARAAERLADLGAEVVLLDPKAPWEKPCGGGLTAAALDNVPDLAAVLPKARRITSVRLEAARSVVTIPLERPLHVLSRTALGLWQLDRARAAGASFEPAAVRRIDRIAGGGWRLHTGDGRTVHVRLLVGADGAASRVRKAVAPELDIELAPARVAYAPGAGAIPCAIGLRFFEMVNGYAWDFPRPDHRSIGVGVAPSTWARDRMDAEVDRYWTDLGHCGCVYADRAGAVIGTAARPLGRRYALLGRGDYAILGDAAGFADPATGEGIHNAIRSADFLAQAFERDATFASYPGIARASLEREFAVARRVRTILYGGSLAPRLIERAATRRWAHALLATVVNGGNSHDPSLLRRFITEWLRLRDGGWPPTAAVAAPSVGLIDSAPGVAQEPCGGGAHAPAHRCECDACDVAAP
jgi:flavin-dependent dehydrogenase